MTIGNFDGVHRGHAALIHRARALAEPLGARVVAVTFDPHPAAILRPGSAPQPLMDFDRRSELLRSLGVDDVVRLQATPELLARSPAEFVADLVKQLHPAAFVEGPDFRFGNGRRGTLDTLRSLGAVHGFTVEVVGPIEVVLADLTIVRASSSLARWLLAHGRVADAAAVLGRWHEIRATVERGDQRGRTIGFPTANLRTDSPLPGDGVYAAWATLPGGIRRPAALSVGVKPTFSGRARVAEAHLLNHDHAGLPEYGWPISIELVAWVRDQVRFGSSAELVAQLARDCHRVRLLLDTAFPAAPTRHQLEGAC